MIFNFIIITTIYIIIIIIVINIIIIIIIIIITITTLIIIIINNISIIIIIIIIYTITFLYSAYIAELLICALQQYKNTLIETILCKSKQKQSNFKLKFLNNYKT